MRKVVCICIMCMFIFVSMFSMLSFSSTADIITSVTANVNEDELSVDVSPGSHGSIVYTGIVEVDCYNTATPLIVELHAETSVGHAVIDKPSMVFQGNHQSDTFQLHVSVEIGTSASEDHSGGVSGTWTQGGRSGAVEGDTFRIIILPYSLPVISCNEPNRNITKGDSVTFKIRLNNSGNTDDVIGVEIEDIEELNAEGIDIKEISDMSIAEGGSKEFNLKVKTSEDTPVLNSIFLVATSTVADEPTDDSLFLTIHARDKELLEVIFNPSMFIIIAVVVMVGIVVYVKRRY